MQCVMNGNRESMVVATRSGSTQTPVLGHLRQHYPGVYSLLDSDRISSRVEADGSADFESRTLGGRGESYRLAQQNPSIRRHGIAALFTLAAPGNDLGSWRRHHVVLDALGGDGTLTRALSSVDPLVPWPVVVTGDLSLEMVSAAQRYGLPAVHQAVQAMRFRDDVLDAVILAYGTHHIPVQDRAIAVMEAHRVLRDGGRLVLHDFDESSPVAGWFANVVDVYGAAPHPHQHFTPEAIQALLESASCAHVRVMEVYDPFVLRASDPLEGKRLLGRHLLNMYGLNRLGPGSPEHTAMEVYELAETYFRYERSRWAPGQKIGAVKVTPTGGEWQVELPRVALVAIGIKA
jgi:SAM-dependent methyltransferase